jgi:NAD(P)-dependent dehydrogenase (short-subunit alcohol dehydrogenase family)
MSDSAQRRIQAIGQQLAGNSSSLGSSPSSGLPPIVKVAPGSSAPRVQGKVVIITGANSPMGIGRATAHQYAESGARAIYLCDLVDTHLQTHKQEIEAVFPDVDVHPKRLDAANEKQVQAVVDEALERYKRLDVFFANAGVTGPPVAFTQYDAEQFMHVLKVNTLRYVTTQ